MAKKIEKTNQKVFPFTLGKLIFILSFVCMALSVAGIVVTILRIVANGGLKVFMDYLKYPLLILICLFCIVFVVSVLIKTSYTIDDKQLIMQYGIIKSTYKLQDFTSLSMDMQTYKLTINLEQSFLEIALKEEWHADFIHAILQGNPSLEVSYTLPDGEKSE